MSIFKIKSLYKWLLVIIAISTAAFKGKEYFPTINNVVEQTVSVVKYDTRECKNLKEFAPEDKISRSEQLLLRKNYITSYNKQTKCPNWVLWELTREKADGNVKRPDYAFHEDMEVSSPRAELIDYRGSGYDRGHMCPAGDNKWDEDAMYESFLMTNMCPQNQQLNSGLWNQIEMQCRYWAKKYGRLYIVCGPIYLRGEHQTIGPNKVVVPDAFFKAIICLEKNPKGIAFVCRNTKGDKKKDYYVNTIRDVERITEYVLFPNLNEKIVNHVKDHANINEW